MSQIAALAYVFTRCDHPKRLRVPYDLDVNRRRGAKAGSQRVEHCAKCGATRETQVGGRELPWQEPEVVTLLRRAALAARASAIEAAADALRDDHPKDAKRLGKLAKALTRPA